MSMLLDLGRIRSASERVDRVFEPAAFESAGEDFRVIAPVDLKAEMQKDGRKFRLVGRLKTTLETACSRCLEPFAIPIDTPFDLLFLPASEAATDAESEIGDDDVGVSFYEDDEIDLGDVLREQFYLALPMKPLCREECQGLCPVCGINRNTGTCDCKTDWIDPRLEGLRNLRSRE
jgi:uncharacterized protein